MTKRDELIKYLRTECKLNPMDAQDVSLIIMNREAKMLDEIEKPLRTGHSDGFKICKALSAIQKYRGDK